MRAGHQHDDQPAQLACRFLKDVSLTATNDWVFQYAVTLFPSATARSYV